MSWFLVALKKYAVFSGRARRKEYWFFILFYVLVILFIGAVSRIVGPAADNAVAVLAGLFVLGMLIPAIAVTVRRLHDIGRSGWWMLILFVPIIGDIVMLVFTVLPSQPGENRFGPNPIEA